MAKKFQFTYPYASYMDVSLMRETRTKKELLAEYKAMRNEANRRLRGLEKYKWMQDSDAYQLNKDKFNGGVSRMTKEQLAKQMREAAIFLTSSSSTVKGQRRRRDRLLDTFRYEWGLSFLNKRNVVDFARFLGAAREHYGAGYYNMDNIEALWKVALKRDKEGVETFDIDKIKKNFTEFETKVKEDSSYAEFYRQAQERFSSEDYDRR